MRARWTLAGLGIVALLAAAPAAADDGDASASVVATVNGEQVLLRDLERRLGRMHGAAAEERRGDFDLDRLMFKVVNDVLLGQEARALGMHEEEPIAGKVRDYRERLAVDRLERQEITERATATEEEIRGAFEEQYSEVSFRVVTAYDQEGAEELLAALRSGADMEELAKERSVDPYRLRGGRVKSLPRIELERSVAEVVFALEPGELAGPVRTDLGWSIVRTETLRPADPERFERQRATLASLARQKKAAALRSRLAKELWDRHRVEVDQEVVAAIVPERLPDGRLVPSELPGDKQVVQVGSRAITAKEYGAALLQRWTGVRNEEAAAAAAPIILQRLIERKLLLVEALARGYDELPAVRTAVYAYETELLIPPFLEEIVAAGVEIGEEEKRAYYEAHREEFRQPPRVRLGQLTLESEEEARRIAELLRGGGDLAWLAREHSTDRFAEAGGDRGWFAPPPNDEELSRRVLEAGVGDVLEPFGALNNWVVLQILDREEPGVYPFEQVSGNVREALFSREFQGALHEFVQTLRERSEIEIARDVLAQLEISGTAEEEGHGPH